MGPQAAVINGLLRNKWLRWLLQNNFGVDVYRPLPTFASQRLSQWFARREPAAINGAAIGRVLLFNDTYLEHF